MCNPYSKESTWLSETQARNQPVTRTPRTSRNNRNARILKLLCSGSLDNLFQSGRDVRILETNVRNCSLVGLARMVRVARMVSQYCTKVAQQINESNWYPGYQWEKHPPPVKGLKKRCTEWAKFGCDYSGWNTSRKSNPVWKKLRLPQSM